MVELRGANASFQNLDSLDNRHRKSMVERRRANAFAEAEMFLPLQRRDSMVERRNTNAFCRSLGFCLSSSAALMISTNVGVSFGCISSQDSSESSHTDLSFSFQMTTPIAIEDVRREEKLCEGGELLDRILSRGGKYTDDDANAVLIQILKVVAFCHLQGVVHRDLKSENFLFMSKDEIAQLKAIDFGLSDFVKPGSSNCAHDINANTLCLWEGKEKEKELAVHIIEELHKLAINLLQIYSFTDERLNDIVGSAYYVAPEVLHRSYSTEADVWSIGVIAYVLLCGSHPFWDRTESGIFRAVLKADPGFEEQPWPTLSTEAKDFVKRLLNKDPRKRMTAAQTLGHPWIKNSHDIEALSKTLTVDELVHLKQQFALLEPNKNGTINLDNIKAALMKIATDAMKEARIHDFVASLNALQYRRMDFEEFCAAALSVYQLEALDQWEQHAHCAYEIFEKDGNRAIMIEELASELGLGPSVPVHAVLHDWIRHTDGKLSFLGLAKLLHGVSIELWSLIHRRYYEDPTQSTGVGSGAP
ncbi:hypothetical protein RND71_034206 [Anisodus tanguticus]|uniref:Uncharacterized protein n=1 Tax=Anisodus tanguticus TaxID=243964 RepID=A0AAE1RC79_9SOLA|nr:hypothetical protein RND71_034206 [Anisodus tanguticus]